MKRLWVRLSLMISGVLFFMFFMQFLTISLEQNGMRPDLDGPPDAPPLQKHLTAWRLTCNAPRSYAST
ncbi:MAG: hypothetical protein IPO22_03895 [Anaerolineales bacterium]|nr:hypothetical protein [Anaerolineales bacterium]